MRAGFGFRASGGLRAGAYGRQCQRHHDSASMAADILWIERLCRGYLEIWFRVERSGFRKLWAPFKVGPALKIIAYQHIVVFFRGPLRSRNYNASNPKP